MLACHEIATRISRTNDTKYFNTWRDKIWCHKDHQISINSLSLAYKSGYFCLTDIFLLYLSNRVRNIDNKACHCRNLFKSCVSWISSIKRNTIIVRSLSTVDFNYVLCNTAKTYNYLSRTSLSDYLKYFYKNRAFHVTR